MKKIILISLTFIISFNLFSQNYENVILVNKQFVGKDTTRTFLISLPENDSCISILFRKWGTPDSFTAGTFNWKNIDLPGIGTDLQIQLLDGIFYKYEKKGKYVYFQSDKHKAKLLKQKKGGFRYTTIKIMDANEKNIINTIELENKCVETLSGLLAGD